MKSIAHYDVSCAAIRHVNIVDPCREAAAITAQVPQLKYKSTPGVVTLSLAGDICFDKPAKASLTASFRSNRTNSTTCRRKNILTAAPNMTPMVAGAGDYQARKDARDSYKARRTRELEDQYINEGMSRADARTKANIGTLNEMSHLNALHALDMVASGLGDKIIKLGSRIVNRSLGARWKTRVGKLDDYAEQAKKDGQKKMKVRLVEC